MNDPLDRYPAMMTVSDLADFLGIGYSSAFKLMKQLPSVNVGLSTKYLTLRIPKEYVRKKYILYVIDQQIDVHQEKYESKAGNEKRARTKRR